MELTKEQKLKLEGVLMAYMTLEGNDLDRVELNRIAAFLLAGKEKDAEIASKFDFVNENNVFEIMGPFCEEYFHRTRHAPFECPECGHDKLECCYFGEWTREVELGHSIVNGPQFEYGKILFGGDGQISHYRCVACGFIPCEECEDDDGEQLFIPIDDETNIVNWINKKHNEKYMG